MSARSGRLAGKVAIVTGSGIGRGCALMFECHGARVMASEINPTGAAVQIAKACGAHIIATASARNHEYLKSIGADEVIDYRSTRFEEHVRNLDMVLGTVGGDTLERSIAVLRRGGRLVSIVAPPSTAKCASAGVRCPTPGRPTSNAFGPWLREVTALVEAGKFRINVGRVFRLEEAGVAQELNRVGHTRGKIVLRVTP